MDKAGPLLAFALFGLTLPLPQQPAVRTIFADEFSGSDLNRAHWSVVVTGRTVNNEQQAYVDSPDVLSVTDGALVIRPRFRRGFKTPDGRSFDFISGRLESKAKVTFTYGTAAARMKLPAGAGLWPAFWALVDGRWPDTGEIDIMENVGDPAWTSVALHGPGYSGNTPLVKRSPFAGLSNVVSASPSAGLGAGGGDATAWHVYALDWTPDLMVFKRDDREVYRVTRAMVEAHGRWAFDNPRYLILNLALGGNFPAAVNKVTAPYHGLPRATVQSIQKDEPQVLVDWVRITGR